MKLLFLAFFLLHLALLAAGQLRRSDVKTPRDSLTGGRSQLPQDAGFWIQGTHRPLFARRKVYKRQRTMTKKPKKTPVPPQEPLPSPTVKVDRDVPPSSCSQLAQSCTPQFGCCDPQALCHCRFFNAVCFCRKFGQGG